MATESGMGLSILSFAGVSLAFPLQEAVSIQRSQDLEKIDQLTLAAGSMVYADKRWPVFQLDANFKPLTDSLPANVYCVCLSADGGQTGVALTCETVESIQLKADQPTPDPLPVCMQLDATPLQQLFLHNDHLLAVSSAPALTAYLKSLMEEYSDQVTE